MIKHIPLTDCRRCSNIKPYTYTNLMNSVDLGWELEELVGHTKGMGVYEYITQCPDCGTYYMNTNECGLMENDIEVKRISPTRAGEILTSQDIEWLTQQLNHPDAATRTYTEMCLRDYKELPNLTRKTRF